MGRINFINKLSILLILILTTILLSACGGGGSSSSIIDDFFGAGKVRIEIKPSTIDTGDRTLVSVAIDEIHPDGIILKVRFPDALEYVLDSAALKIDSEEEEDAGPSFNGLDDDEHVFLVFFLEASTFGDSGKGTLTFELEATTSVTDGEVSVDIDVDDPLIADETEFDVSTPEFLAEDATNITVQE